LLIETDCVLQAPEDLYALPLIQCNVQPNQWKGWFQANDLTPPRYYGLRFDRIFKPITAAMDGLGVVLESTLLAEHAIASGKWYARSSAPLVKFTKLDII